MLTRTSRKTATFAYPFRLRCLDRTLPAGDYKIVTDEELIEGLSFPVYRRVATMMMVPLNGHTADTAVEMITIAPDDLSKALARDREARVRDSDENKGADVNR